MPAAGAFCAQATPPETPQRIRARELLAMGVHPLMVERCVRLAPGDLAELWRELAS
jgi:hypothetical protein